MPEAATSTLANDRLTVEDSGTDYSSGSGRSHDGSKHSSGHHHHNTSHETTKSAHIHTRQYSGSSPNSSFEGNEHSRSDKLVFKAKTVRELLEKMSKVKIRVNDKKVSGFIPFIEPICPGHPFTDLFPSSCDRSSTDKSSAHPSSGYDVEDTSSSS